jgi:PTS system nitrogen regulatory IIA component
MQILVSDAARILKVPEKTIYDWIKHESIPYYMINEQYRFNLVELLEWASSQRMMVSPDVYREVESDEELLPSLLESLKAGGISYHVGGNDKASVLRAVIDTFSFPAGEDVDREFLYQVLLSREALGSTCVGDGVAIPHVRNPVVLHVTQPSISLCFLEHPINFGAPDGQPVNILFTLISPTVRAHLHLLSRLSFALQDKAFKAALKRQAPREELMETLSSIEMAQTALSSGNAVPIAR